MAVATKQYRYQTPRIAERTKTPHAGMIIGITVGPPSCVVVVDEVTSVEVHRTLEVSHVPPDSVVVAVRNSVIVPSSVEKLGGRVVGPGIGAGVIPGMALWWGVGAEALQGSGLLAIAIQRRLVQ